MNDKPLVTILMLTYNQEKYVRESVRGLLAQTYEPLEIIISDDCSSDRTWDIINEEVDAYKLSRGVHNNILLNRNVTNLGIAQHFNVIEKLSHGVLHVCNAGDDVSLPNRVERIVEEWIKNNQGALAIYHGAWKIDSKGQCVGQLGEFYFNEGTLGAVASYSNEMGSIFGPIVELGAAEDEVYGNRALILNRRLNIRENLLKYRIDVGVSSGRKDYRRKQIRVLRDFKLAAFRQAFIDLEQVRSMVSLSRYNELKKLFGDRMTDARTWLCLWDDESIRNRFAAYKKVLWNVSNVRLVIATILLLPRRIGDVLLCILNYVLEEINGVTWIVKRNFCRRQPREFIKHRILAP